VQYLLFAEEAPLTAPVKGTSNFQKEFQALGPKESKGRSLRDFDLQTRLFAYPCSFLIYSESFEALPKPVKDKVYARLYDVLSGKEQSEAYERLTPAMRRAILEILRDTKKDLPDNWKNDKDVARDERRGNFGAQWHNTRSNGADLQPDCAFVRIDPLDPPRVRG